MKVLKKLTLLGALLTTLCLNSGAVSNVQYVFYFHAQPWNCTACNFYGPPDLDLMQAGANAPQIFNGDEVIATRSGCGAPAPVGRIEVCRKDPISGVLTLDHWVDVQFSPPCRQNAWVFTCSPSSGNITVTQYGMYCPCQ